MGFVGMIALHVQNLINLIYLVQAQQVEKAFQTCHTPFPLSYIHLLCNLATFNFC